MSNTLTTKIADLLFLEPSSLKNLVRKEQMADIKKDVDALLNRYEKTLRNHLGNARAPVPGGDGSQRSYPDVSHEHLPVPSPDETETSIPSKVSTPNYDDFAQRIESLQTSLETLFDDSADRETKVSSMREAISAMDDLGEWLKQL
jgi:hypothetical protein